MPAYEEPDQSNIRNMPYDEVQFAGDTPKPVDLDTNFSIISQVPVDQYDIKEDDAVIAQDIDEV